MKQYILFFIVVTPVAYFVYITNKNKDKKEESKNEPKQDFKEGSKEGSKEESKQDFKEESKDESKQDFKDESKQDFKDESKQESKNKPKQDFKDESKNEPKQDFKDESEQESKVKYRGIQISIIEKNEKIQEENKEIQPDLPKLPMDLITLSTYTVDIGIGNEQEKIQEIMNKLEYDKVDETVDKLRQFNEPRLISELLQFKEIYNNNGANLIKEKELNRRLRIETTLHKCITSIDQVLLILNQVNVEQMNQIPFALKYCKHISQRKTELIQTYEQLKLNHDGYNKLLSQVQTKITELKNQNGNLVDYRKELDQMKQIQKYIEFKELTDDLDNFIMIKQDAAINDQFKSFSQPKLPSGQPIDFYIEYSTTTEGNVRDTMEYIIKMDNIFKLMTQMKFLKALSCGGEGCVQIWSLNYVMFIVKLSPVSSRSQADRMVVDLGICKELTRANNEIAVNIFKQKFVDKIPHAQMDFKESAQKDVKAISYLFQVSLYERTMDMSNYQYRQYNIQEQMYIIKNVLETFEQMENIGYYYMDAKMENILIDDNFQVKICDPGSFVSKEDFIKKKYNFQMTPAINILNSSEYNNRSAKSQIYVLGGMLFSMFNSGQQGYGVKHYIRYAQTNKYNHIGILFMDIRDDILAGKISDAINISQIQNLLSKMLCKQDIRYTYDQLYKLIDTIGTSKPQKLIKK